jgi:hypothetical protein
MGAGAGGLNMNLSIPTNGTILLLGRGIGPFDGTIDFAGTSGATISTNRSVQMNSVFTLDSNPDKIAALIGSGVVRFQLSSPMTSMTGPGNGSMGAETNPSAIVTVNYYVAEQ